MAAFKVRNLWNAFITAFFALLASVGLSTAATTAAAQPVAQTPDEPANADRPQARRATVPAQSRRSVTRPTPPAARDRSLPPTMKQRIGAEAHGSSPAVRHLPALDTSGQDPAGRFALAAGRTASTGAAPAYVSAPGTSEAVKSAETVDVASVASVASAAPDSAAADSSRGSTAGTPVGTAPTSSTAAADLPAAVGESASADAATGRPDLASVGLPASSRADAAADALAADPYAGSPTAVSPIAVSPAADAGADSGTVVAADFGARGGEQSTGSALLAA